MDLFGEEPQAPEENTPPPEVESQEGLVAPRQMDFCLGHDHIEQRLLELVQSGRLPHGLIFAGQKGIGKATMAYRLARFLLKAEEGATSLDMDPGDNVFRRVASGGHPDFMSVERAYDAAKNRYKDSVAVDEIRKVPGFLRMTASEGGWRVVIIDDADTMNRNAQNALLKVLEEPPGRTILILVAHRPGALIPTIRSRAQTIHFQPLADDVLHRLLEKHNPDLGSQDTKTLIELGEGSIGKAIQYSEEGGLEALSQILALFRQYPEYNWPEIHALADNLARPGQDQAYRTFTTVLKWLLARLCVLKARGLNPDGSALDQDALKAILRNSSLEQLLKICENLHSHFEKVNAASLDKRQGILGAFSLMAA